MLTWTYRHETEIEVTDGRQHMYLSRHVIPALDQWFVHGTHRAFVSYQNFIVLDQHDPTRLVWNGFGEMPVVGTVRKSVAWPRDEVQQVIRTIYVAERLRAQSEPHILYLDQMERRR